MNGDSIPNPGFAPPVEPTEKLHHGAKPGHFGNQKFIPTEEQRARVRELAKLYPAHAQRSIAVMMGISEDTLQRHFKYDIELGRAELVASVAAQLINRAMDAEARGPDGRLVAKGDLDAQKFVLSRLGGWTTKVDITARQGASEQELADLSRLSDEDLEQYARLAAIAEGDDPEELVNMVRQASEQLPNDQDR